MDITEHFDTEEDAMHYEILLGLYFDAEQKKEELKKMEFFVVANMAESMFCHSCSKPIKAGQKFIAFHDSHEAIRYADMLRWREGKSCINGKKW